MGLFEAPQPTGIVITPYSGKGRPPKTCHRPDVHRPVKKTINGANPIKSKPGTRKRKMNIDKVKALAAQGVIPTDIARNQSVSVAAVTRYLKSIGVQAANVKQYSNGKAAALAASQLKAGAIADLIMDNLLADPEKNILSQDVKIQKEILIAANSIKTFDHNQERLERGQATSITDVRSLIVELDLAEARELAKAGKTVDNSAAPQDIVIVN